MLGVGPLGDFLGQKSTRKHLRSGEHYHPVVAARQSYESWDGAADHHIRKRAQKKVAEILAQPPKSYLPEEVVAKLDIILTEAETELCQSE